MKKKFMLLTFLIVIVAFFSLLKHKAPGNTVSINNKTFNIEIAKTQAQQEVGLSKYEKVEDNFGMYFLFDKPDYYKFWMQDMKFPIDIIYIYKNEIVEIFKNVQNPHNNIDPLTIYKPAHVADSVFEINAGLSDRYGFKNGEHVQITNK
jgi:uncharacterized membrane protein (UPF0127 family)